MDQKVLCFKLMVQSNQQRTRKCFVSIQWSKVISNGPGSALFPVNCPNYSVTDQEVLCFQSMVQSNQQRTRKCFVSSQWSKVISNGPGSALFTVNGPNQCSKVISNGPESALFPVNCPNNSVTDQEVLCSQSMLQSNQQRTRKCFVPSQWSKVIRNGPGSALFHSQWSKVISNGPGSALFPKGKMSMFELGKLFRQRYQGFLSRLYSPKEMHMESSANDRCLMSAELVLAGLYPPIGSQVWNHDLNWQPIPVHSTPRLQDKVTSWKEVVESSRIQDRLLYTLRPSLNPSSLQHCLVNSLQLIVMKKPCPRYEQELKQAYLSPDIVQVNLDNAELYSYLTEMTGKDIDSILEVELLYNTLEIEVEDTYEPFCLMC
uniref:Uncharacterized protein n=1 Tax=Timema tahoe TaxID=61484 RepID=A0A7R9P0P7_9NEOP|nr:unnamed protein product [Timema tahoe]